MSEDEVKPKDERASRSEAKPEDEPASLANHSPPGSAGGLIALVVAGLVIAVGAALYFKPGHPEARSSAGAGGSLVGTLEGLGHVAGAKRVREACAAAQSCACRQAMAHAALDANLHAEALGALSGDEACTKEAASREMQAEALARAGRCSEAVTLSSDILLTGGKAPFARYATAHCAYSSGETARAVTEAGMAAEMGRGGPAHLLVGLIAYRSGDLGRARAEFQKMLELDADDVDARYNLALIAQQQSRYRDAREGYLRVLKLAPGHLDARFNLGLLTHSVGALDEARHDLEELERVAPPGDERVRRLRAVLDGPAPPPHAGAVIAAPSFAVPSSSGAPAPSR